VVVASLKSVAGIHCIGCCSLRGFTWYFMVVIVFSTFYDCSFNVRAKIASNVMCTICI
jgi:hypothetical protein